MLPCIFATPVVTVNIGDLIKPVAAQQKKAHQQFAGMLYS
ncbi:hypothetical protein Nizo3400_1891 [Lactiplantibacillus plantarum]|nr:hypothetical protein Nizo3400_1891 [Lactiplantibacillus plantarum]